MLARNQARGMGGVYGAALGNQNRLAALVSCNRTPAFLFSL
jgi:hypothetical protein